MAADNFESCIKVKECEVSQFVVKKQQWDVLCSPLHSLIHKHLAP